MPKCERGTTHGANAVDGSYVELQVAVLRALPRDMDQNIQLGWAKNGESLSRVLRKALMPPITSEIKTRTEFLKLISGNEPIIIDAVDGTEFLSETNNVFVSVSQECKKDLEMRKKSLATEETSACVYEMTADATFAQMFVGLSSDLKNFCFTQHQINIFVKKYPKWLVRYGFVTLFLTELNNQFVVIAVLVESLESKKFTAWSSRFLDMRVFEGSSYLVVPKSGLTI